MTRIRDERPRNSSAIPGKVDTYPSSYYLLSEVVILVPVTTCSETTACGAHTSSGVHPFSSTEGTPGSVSVAVAEARAEHLPLSSSSAKDV